MDLLPQQIEARKNSIRLLVLFFLSIVFLVAILNVAVAGYLVIFGGYTEVWSSAFWQSNHFYYASGMLIGSILFIVAIKRWDLKDGGRVVAERLGGRVLIPNTGIASYRRVLNVVEEIAISSRMPVPPVYLLEGEDGINAMVAGYELEDTVVIITAGALKHLDRAEIQGVIAHEFSHIRNGDMRLNMHLIALLHGLQFISFVGRDLWSLRGGGLVWPFVLWLRGIGGVMLLLGSIGMLCATVIKASVSRQREYLADAYAMQFTRDPIGLANALKKIAQCSRGSLLTHHHAREVSHFFFGQAYSIPHRWRTHPPLRDRIYRLEPSWDGRYPDLAARSATTQAKVRDPGIAFSAMGLLPPFLVQQARESFGALAIIFALLLSRDSMVKTRQRQAIQRLKVDGLVMQVEQNAKAIKLLDAEQQWPLVALAVPALRHLSPMQYRALMPALVHVIQADDQLDGLEWCVYQVIKQHLTAFFEAKRMHRVKYHSLRAILPAYETALSFFVAQEGIEQEEQQDAFDQARVELYAMLEKPDAHKIDLREGVSIEAFAKAVEQLSHAPVTLREALLMSFAKAEALLESESTDVTLLLRGVEAVLAVPLIETPRQEP